MNQLIEIKDIAQRIFTLRGVKVMLDRDLAELYGVETKRLKEQVRRNIDRFPPDFMFELAKDEYDGLRSQFAALKIKVSMNKLELIVELAKKQGLSKPESARIVDLFFGSMAKELCNGGRVEIRGLCAFKVKAYPGYTGRNPKSGAPVSVKPKRLPFFKAGTDLKKRVDR